MISLLPILPRLYLSLQQRIESYNRRGNKPSRHASDQKIWRAVTYDPVTSRHLHKIGVWSPDASDTEDLPASIGTNEFQSPVVSTSQVAVLFHLLKFICSKCVVITWIDPPWEVNDETPSRRRIDWNPSHRIGDSIVSSPEAYLLEVRCEHLDSSSMRSQRRDALRKINWLEPLTSDRR